MSEYQNDLELLRAENARLRKMIDALNRWDGQGTVPMEEFGASFPQELLPGVGSDEEKNP